MVEIFEAHQKTALKLRRSSVRERKERLKRLLGWIYRNRDEIAKAVNEDLGKPVVEAELSELLPVTTEIKLALRNLHKWARVKSVPLDLLNVGTRSYIKYEPKGTNLIIAPWNYPFNLTLSPLVSAIAAGNTAIIKPSERIVSTTQLLKRMVSELFDESEITVIDGGVEISQELLKQPFDHIFFTGSPRVGKIVMEAASRHLTSVTLELGGKTPVIVDETADIKDAAKKLAWGKFLNCGQTCIAPDYILVHESKYNELEEQLNIYTLKLYNSKNSGFDKSTDYSSIIDSSHVEHLEEVLNEARSGGANVILGGDKDSTNNFFSPTIISGMPASSRVMNEEIFGPILPLQKYSSLDEAISLINEKPKPLALYLFTRSARNQEKVIYETSSGGVNINDTLIQFANNNLPFGGINNSGLGNSHGYFGFKAFSNEKAILKQRVGITAASMFYPPYTPIIQKLVRFVVRYF